MVNEYDLEHENIGVPFYDIDILNRNTGIILGRKGKIYISGIYVESNTIIDRNEKLLIEFKLPDSHISIIAYSKVDKIDKQDNSFSDYNYLIFLKYLLIEEADTKKIQYFIDSRIFNYHINSDDYTLADFINIPSEDLFEKTNKFWAFVEDWKNKGNYTLRKHLLTASKNRIILYDPINKTKKEKINMGSGNYLGLSYHPRVIEAAEKALKVYGNSSVGAPMHTGTYDIHVKLENKLAEMKGCEEVMLFPSGYTTNIGCISALLMKDDIAILDRLAHRSIIDGCSMAAGTYRTFKHSDMNDLERILENCKDKYNGKMIIVDGIYSTEGDICPLPEIVKLSRKYNAKVMVDDAHAMGVIGDNGRGTINYYKMEGEVDLVVGTLSKALGCLGGFIGSSKEVINYLRHYARSSSFSCNLPPSIAASAITAIEIMEQEPERIEQLWKNVRYLKDNLINAGFNVMDFHSAIIPIIIGNDVIGKRMAMRILDEGVYLSYFPFPAVPVGKERLRLTVMSTHTQEDLDKTIEIFEKTGREFGVIDNPVNEINESKSNHIAA